MGYTPWGCIDLVSAGTGEMKKNATALSTWIKIMRATARWRVAVRNLCLVSAGYRQQRRKAINGRKAPFSPAFAGFFFILSYTGSGSVKHFG